MSTTQQYKTTSLTRLTPVSHVLCSGGDLTPVAHSHVSYRYLTHTSHTGISYSHVSHRYLTYCVSDTITPLTPVYLTHTSHTSISRTVCLIRSTHHSMLPNIQLLNLNLFTTTLILIFTYYLHLPFIYIHHYASHKLQQSVSSFQANMSLYISRVFTTIISFLLLYKLCNFCIILETMKCCG